MLFAATDTGLLLCVPAVFALLLGEALPDARIDPGASFGEDILGIDACADFGEDALRIDPDVLIMWSRRLLHL